MLKRTITVFAVVALLGGAAFADRVDGPHLLIRGGARTSIIPTFDPSVYLGGTYALDGFDMRAETTLGFMNGLHLFQQFGIAFYPDDLGIGADAGFTISPFFLADANAWAETPILDAYLGESDILVNGIAGAELWLGGIFGGAAFFRAIADVPGDVPVSATSITSVSYDQMRGLGLEEEIDLRVRFESPKLFGGQLLSENDLSAVVTYVRAGCRLERNGFALTGIVAGIEVEFRSPLSAEVEI